MRAAGVLVLTGILCEVFGYLLCGPPQGPDELFSVSQVIGVLLVFVFWMLSIFAWGSLLARWLKFKREESFLAVALGTFLAASVGALLGHCGLLRVKVLSLIFLIIGLLGNFYFSQRDGRPPRQGLNLTNSEKAVFAALFAGGLMYFLKASILSSFWDPLWYNLTAPRIWFEAGHITFSKTNMSLFLASYWDYLYLWPQILLAEPGGKGLIAAQYFGQWTHLVFGFGGVILALYSLARRLGYDISWSLLAAWGGASTYALRYTTSIAKNDWGVAFWAITAATLLMGQGLSRVGLATAGVFAGFAFATKPTTAFFIAPFLLYWIFVNIFRDQAKKTKLLTLFWFVVPFVFSVIPFFVRNYFYTGNPLFPSFNELFYSSWLGPTWEQALVGYEGRWFHFDVLHNLWKEWSLGGFLTWPILLIPIHFIFFKTSKTIWPIFLVILGSTCLFICRVGQYSETRILGATAVLAASLAVLSIRDLLGLVGQERKSWGVWAVLLIFVFFSEIPWTAPVNLFGSSNPAIQIREHAGGGALAWLREHMKASEAAVSLADSRIYYASYLKVERLWDNADLDRKIVASKTAKDVISILRDAGYTYIYNTTQPLDYFYNAELVRLVMDAFEAHREAEVYKSGFSVVVDLRKLERLL